MKKSILVGISTFALVAGFAALPIATIARDASEHHELKQAKETIKDSIVELKEALKEAREHGDDANWCNHIQLAIDAARAAKQEIIADLHEDN